ncbi:MAG: hypothetical protein IPL55_03065 [Saprospiraceae bacterium]|jgi:hypothetical protein|nr:hypothetical protein [Saprospiraceae bacterium]MBL0026735.1 hypothetical protein [Saprospiraceae bacterium]
MKLRFILLLFVLAMIFVQCSGPKKATMATSESMTMKAISFTTDIKPIMVNHCAPCHFPETGKKKLLDTYIATKDNIVDIITRVQLDKADDKFMPFKLKKEPLSDSLITVLKNWRKSGMAE